ncbi:phenylalanine--tRNA ligase subunit beta, partial [bacterium]|nr:phenylalanine--tRNA ligase subunit beta [bacterium]
MYLSLNWLKEYVPIPGSLSPEELGDKLTMHTVEIDGIEREADRLACIVVGKILEIKKHPNADRLQLVVVDVGEDDNLEIVCGAFNIEAGQMVPVALIGAVLPSGTEIREVEVRGVKSQGMLCAEDELGLGDDHAGIMIFDKSAKLGQKLGEYLKLKDVVFEVDNKSITNRPDLWGHYGMAREISTFLNIKLNKKIIEFDLDKLSKGATDKIKVIVEDHKLCPRYMGIALSGIKVKASPGW